MDFVVYVFLLLFSDHCQAFLLDTVTQISPTNDQSLTDKHFDILMDLLMEQRRSQRKQDQVITQMSQALLTLQHEVSKYQNQSQSGSVNIQLLECENKTEMLQRKLDTVIENFETMKVEYMLVVQNLTIVDTKANQIDKEIGMLKNLKSVSYLHNISDILNKTDRNELEIQMTSHRMNEIINDANARKQDVIALYNKADLTEQTLDKHLKELADRVYITARPIAGTYTAGQILTYKSVELKNGIKNVTSFQTSGIFTCEKRGIYQISIFITTNPHTSRFIVYKNKDLITETFSSFDSFYSTGSTIVVTQMKVGDTLYVKAITVASYVYNGNYESGISIVQLQ
ncbi:unnamed protein product [Mytilus edulis]|uniref:C1q domain-containing protein n=1 Tax=Mytilus edulis TaxID=6550 RepID=A0A8S3RRQ9_MYTED|nr:unnamed protein product [Mytilus edulis]